MKLFVTFGGLSWQKGSAAQLVSLAEVARSIEPDVEIVLESHAFDLDAPRARELGIGIVGHPGSGLRSPQEGSFRLVGVHAGLILYAILGFAGWKWRWLVRNDVAQAMLGSDLVADLSGDSYRDRPGGFALAHTWFLLSAIWCGKPVVIVSQSLGPFRWYSRTLTRYCLNRTVRIYTRERRTVALLRKLGVNAERISLAPDIAFCLPATPAEQGLRCLPADPAEELARRRGPLIGISLSSLMMGLPEVGGPEYIATMARIVLFLRKKYGARVLLVPHVVTPRTWGGCDDAGVATELMKAIGPLSGISAVEGDVTASELKALIAQCELFLGARMHAAIAALSSGVPTIMLSWSHKYAGLMEEIGLGRFVWNIGASPSVLEELIDEAWNSRNAIREVLHAYNGRAQHLVRLEVARVLEIGQRAAGRRLDATVPHIRPDRIQNDPRVVRPIQTLLDHSPGSASQTGP